MRRPLLDEGEWLFLKWGLAFAILLAAAFTVVVWPITVFNAYGAEPTRVLAPAMPAAEAPAADVQPYIINLVRDPENLLIPPGENSRSVRRVEHAQALLAKEKVAFVPGEYEYRMTFYGKGMGSKALASYRVIVREGRGFLRVPISEVERAGSMTMEAPDELKAKIKYPWSGVLDWYDWELLHVVRGRPKHGWFVLK